MDGVDMLKKWRDTCQTAQLGAILDYCRVCELYPVCPFYDASNIGELDDDQIEALVCSIEEV